MFVCVKINDSDFEQIRQIIMLQNDIKSEHYFAKNNYLCKQ